MTREEQQAPTIPAPPVKACGCGASYDALAWNSLPFVGTMDDGAGGIISLRNCSPPCLSTLAVEIAS